MHTVHNQVLNKIENAKPNCKFSGFSVISCVDNLAMLHQGTCQVRVLRERIELAMKSLIGHATTTRLHLELPLTLLTSAKRAAVKPIQKI